MGPFITGAAIGFMWSMLSSNWFGTGVPWKHREHMAQFAFRVMIEVVVMTIFLGTSLAVGLPPEFLMAIAGFLSMRAVLLWVEAKWLKAL